MPNDTELVAYLQHIDPEHKDEYIEAHDNVPEGVTDAMERGGVERFRLFVRDTIAVCVLEADDPKAYFDAVEDDPAVEEWERFVAQFKEEGVDVDADEEQIPLMDEIWAFDADENTA